MLETTANLSIADLRQKNLPITVNGVPVGSSNELTVLPGGYVFDTGLDRIDYGDAVTTVSAPGSRQTAPDLSPSLTHTGHDDLIDAARTSLDDCLTSADLAPAGCPFGAKLPDGSTAESVTWKLIGDPFSDVQPTLEWTDHGVARLPVQVKVLLTATVRTGNSTGSIEQEIIRNATAETDILDEPLRLIWRN
ncbi:MAG: hypothetical protein GXX86_07165 [Propionibacterium sp.]|nr:hypothetical protein [Propionibacterium sp.]